MSLNGAFVGGSAALFSMLAIFVCDSCSFLRCLIAAFYCVNDRRWTLVIFSKARVAYCLTVT